MSKRKKVFVVVKYGGKVKKIEIIPYICLYCKDILQPKYDGHCVFCKCKKLYDWTPYYSRVSGNVMPLTKYEKMIKCKEILK